MMRQVPAGCRCRVAVREDWFITKYLLELLKSVLSILGPFELDSFLCEARTGLDNFCVLFDEKSVLVCEPKDVRP